MSKHKKDPLLVALEQGNSFTWTMPDGGDFASMRKAIKHGQTLTMSPVTDLNEVQVGDIVLVRWHQGYMKHLVSEIQGDQFLIANSVGKINGWVNGADILGKITQIIDPEPRPSVPIMLEQLEAAYRKLIQLDQPSNEDAQRLLGIMEDLRWYAGRFGSERWDQMPRSNLWSFEQYLWRLTRQAKRAISPASDRIRYFIDRGKACVGLVSEIYALLEYGDTE